jgi:FkbM family methyltransferase
LRENLSVNEVSHVDVIQAAAGAGDGTMAFVGFDESDGNSGVSRAAHGADRVDFVSRVVALDALLDSRRIARVDLLKLDIEGGELAALDGMSDGLRNARYRFVLLECHPQELARLGTSLDDCLSPFVRAGYQGWRIDHSPAMHRRAAALYVPTSELLAPLDLSAATTDVWPHFLWVAPGEALPE